MYSLVVMAALTTGGDAPDFGRRAGCHCYTACHSCYGCWGGACYGNVYCHGYSSGYGCHSYCHGCYGCASCYGCHACSGYIHCSGWGCHGWGAPMYMEAAPMKKEKEEKKDDKKGTALPDENRARLVIDLPADAKLSIDDQPMKATTARRSFSTPRLEQGQTYYYILKVEVVRDGTPITESRRVLIRAGEEINASFSEETIAAAAKANVTASK